MIAVRTWEQLFANNTNTNLTSMFVDRQSLSAEILGPVRNEEPFLRIWTEPVLFIYLTCTRSQYCPLFAFFSLQWRTTHVKSRVVMAECLVINGVVRSMNKIAIKKSSFGQRASYVIPLPFTSTRTPSLARLFSPTSTTFSCPILSYSLCNPFPLIRNTLHAVEWYREERHCVTYSLYEL